MASGDKIQIYTRPQVDILLANKQSKLDNNINNLNYIENTLDNKGSGVVVKPKITAPSQIKYSTGFTLLATESKTAFKDNGAEIDHYEWILPDNSIMIGNSITYIAPSSAYVGQTITFKCRAVDTLGNTSIYNTIDILVSDNTAPTINNLIWDNNEHYDNTTYILTIDATDLDGNTLTYGVTSDPNTDITIVQDGSNPNIFYVTYGDLSIDKYYTFNVTVSDGLASDSKSDVKLVHAFLPTGQTAIIAGGYDGNNIFNTVDYVIISTLSNSKVFGELNDHKRSLEASSNGVNSRGVFGGGSYLSAPLSNIDYINITVMSNASNFGNLSQAKYLMGSASNGTNDRAIFGAGTTTSVYLNTVEYITISTPSNTQDFGDLILQCYDPSSTSNGTNDRAVFNGGHGTNTTTYNVIEYLTISTPSNAQDFGDLINTVYASGATSNATFNRGVIAGGASSSNVYSLIQYFNISVLSNSISFGNLSAPVNDHDTTSNGTNNRALNVGGYGLTARTNVIEYFNISIPSNAQDFGDLHSPNNTISATSNA